MAYSLRVTPALNYEHQMLEVGGVLRHGKVWRRTLVESLGKLRVSSQEDRLRLHAVKRLIVSHRWGLLKTVAYSKSK